MVFPGGRIERVVTVDEDQVVDVVEKLGDSRGLPGLPHELRLGDDIAKSKHAATAVSVGAVDLESGQDLGIVGKAVHDQQVGPKLPDRREEDGAAEAPQLVDRHRKRAGREEVWSHALHGGQLDPVDPGESREALWERRARDDELCDAWPVSRESAADRVKAGQLAEAGRLPRVEQESRPRGGRGHSLEERGGMQRSTVRSTSTTARAS